MHRFLSALLLVVVSLGPASGISMALEQPEYTVVTATDAYEVRAYNPYIVAETVVEGDLRRSGATAFRRLAGYIFGRNQDEEKMAMTAPVETRRADDASAMMLAQPAGQTQFAYAFVMERKYSLDTLPAPNDPGVTLREVPGRTVAARRYSGRWTDGNYQKNETELIEALRADGYRIVGAPMLARYNGPLTPWFMRRNEVLVEVELAPVD